MPIILFLLLQVVSSKCQCINDHVIDFTGTSAFYVSAIAVDSIGNGYIAATEVNQGTPNTVVIGNDIFKSSDNCQAFIAKYSSAGIQQWAIATDSNNHATITGLSVDPSSQYLYVTGTFYPLASLGGKSVTSIGSAYFFAKMDLNGNTIWIKQDGASGDEYDGITSSEIAVANDGGIYVSGTVYGDVSINDSTPINASAFLVKYDSSGKYEWSKFSYGSSPYQIGIDSESNVYVSGNTFANTNFDSDTLFKGLPRSAYIVKYSSTGQFQWLQTIAVIDSPQDKNYTNYSYAAVDKNGNSYLYANFDGKIRWNDTTFIDPDTEGTEPNMLLTKLANDGTVLWAKIISTKSPIISAGMDVTDDGNIYLTGEYFTHEVFGVSNLPITGTPIFLAKFDGSGSFVWLKEVKNNLPPGFIESWPVKTFDNIVYVGGLTGDTTNIDNIQTNTAGIYNNFVWILACPETAGINETALAQKSIKAFPNPSTNNVVIEFNQTIAGDVEFALTDIVGRKVQSSRLGYLEIGNQQTTLNLSSVPSGIYQCELTNPEGHYVTQIIKTE